MNLPRIKELAIHLRDQCEWHGGAGPGDIEDTGCFCLARWRYDCGAPACIAGHTVAMFGEFPRWTEEDGYQFPLLDMASNLLDLDKVAGEQLFMPNVLTHTSKAFELFRRRDMSSVHPEQAADVLDHLAATGRVDWDILLEEEDA